MTTLLDALVDRATVYTLDGTSNMWDAVGRSDLACRLTHLAVTGVGDGRSELLARRKLLFEAGYAMPGGARLLIDGLLWQVVRGSIATMRGPDGTESHRRCEVERVYRPEDAD